MRCAELALREILTEEQWESIVKESIYNRIEIDPKVERPDLTTSALNMVPDVVRSRKKPKLVFQPKPLSKRFSHKTHTQSTD